MRCRVLACVCVTMLLLAGCNAEPSMDYVSLPAPVNEPVISVTGRSTPREILSDVLGQIGTPAVPALIAALTDPDPVVRVQACRALAYMGAKARDAVSALMQALNDSQEAVQLEAAKALGAIGESSGPAVPRLMEMLREKR